MNAKFFTFDLYIKLYWIQVQPILYNIFAIINQTMVDHLADDSDVLWQDDDVCILKPETVCKGIVVYHAFPI